MASKTNTVQLKNKLTIAAGAASKSVSTTAYVNQVLHAYKNQISQILPKCLTVPRMANIMVNAVRTTPKLAECSQESFLGAIIQAAMLGLEPNTPLGHAWLIPFKSECTLIPGYRGFLELARRSGQLKAVAAQAVREGDFFEYEYGFDEMLRHRPAAEYNETAEITHAYAYATLDGGYRQFVVMSRGQILAIRNQSSGYKSALYWNEVDNRKREQKGQDQVPVDSPWVSHEDQMFCKTAIRRLYKLLPCSVDMAVLATLDDTAESGKPQGLGRVLEGEAIDVSPEPEAQKAIEDDATVTAIGRQFMPKEVEQLKVMGFVVITDANGHESFISEHGELFDHSQHKAHDDGSPAVGANGEFVKVKT